MRTLFLLLVVCLLLPLAARAQVAPTDSLAPGPNGYPEDALRQGIEGSVVLEVTADRNGKYVSHRVLQSSHPLLLRYVEEQLVRQRSYPPAAPWPRKKHIVPFEFRMREHVLPPSTQDEEGFGSDD